MVLYFSKSAHENAIRIGTNRREYFAHKKVNNEQYMKIYHIWIYREAIETKRNHQKKHRHARPQFTTMRKCKGNILHNEIASNMRKHSNNVAQMAECNL